MVTKNGRKAQESDSDTDFQERDESDEEPESDEGGVEFVASRELASSPKHTGKLVPI